MKTILSITLCLISFSISAVELGMERFIREYPFERLANKKIAVLAHTATQNSIGQHLIDELISKNLKLVSIFAPEHGLRSREDDHVGDYTDARTGLPVYSLYGPRKFPTDDQLANVDYLIIDLQDVGMRFYTYSITMALTMKACKHNGVKVIVLDRPNPIGGKRVEGPLLDDSLRGWLSAYYPIPMVHGMTLAELALFYNKYFEINSDLEVIPMLEWDREQTWEALNLPWISPSPALPRVEQSYLYSLYGLFESLNLAVGRSKQNFTAFRYYGAPWITDEVALKLVKTLNDLKLPGLEFNFIEWTVERREYTGEIARGFEILLVDHTIVDYYRSMIETMKTLFLVLGDDLKSTKTTIKFLGQEWLIDAIKANTNYHEISLKVLESQKPFLDKRQTVLLY